MKRVWILVAVLVSVLTSTTLFADGAAMASGPSRQAVRAIQVHPLAFEPNLGQAPRGTSFVARTEAGTMFVQGASLVWASAADNGGRRPLRLKFEGARRAPGPRAWTASLA